MSKLWIQLARTGDILNILPLLWKDAQSGGKSAIMVARGYQDVLEGCSYVDPYIFEGEPHDINGAMARAAKLPLENLEIICTQVNGPADAVLEHVYRPAGQNTAVTTSYQKEQWRVAGRLGEWDACYPLIFDRRDAAREKAMLVRMGIIPRAKKLPIILLATEGISSPFEHAELLHELLQGRFGRTHRIVCLPRVYRFYDLLALYEQAEVLVAVDSAPLHLARAVPSLPVVALTNDKPILWNGSSWTANHIAYCRYGDFPKRAVELLKSIEQVRSTRDKSREVVFIRNDLEPEQAGICVDPWSVLAIAPGMCGRDARNTLQDTKPVPYLRDCVRMAMQKPGCKFVALARPSTNLQNIPLAPQVEAAYAYRLKRTKEGDTFHPIADFFYASRKWWQEHLSDMPDFVLGKDYFFSHGLWAFFKKHGAIDITGHAYREEGPKATTVPIPLPPRIRHNKTLCEKFIEANHISSRYPQVTDQIETVAQFGGMLRNAYNPSIIEHQGKILMTARYHTDSTATHMMMVTLDRELKIFRSEPLEIPGKSIEDARCFLNDGVLHLSWVDSNLPAMPFFSTVRYAKWENETLGPVMVPDLPGNDGQSMQKNWVFFPFEQALYCLHRCQPDQVIYKIEPNATPIVCTTPGPRWAYGTIRGGTQPVPYQGKWLRFFHGGMDNEFGANVRRYCMGALLMNPKPPFEVVRVSSKPILYGSEVDSIKVKDRPPHWKQNVVFPGGVVARPDHWLVSVGINDCASAIVKVRPGDLHL